MCWTCMPSLTGSVQARTPGQPSTSTRQFGHWPAQHISPRGRWYLKLRERTFCPDGVEGRADRVALVGLDGLAVEVERDRRGRG